MIRIQVKERSNSFGLCTHPDVRDYRGISVYVRGYRGKGRVYHFSNVFRDGQ